MKKPRPLIAMSNVRPVLASEPCSKLRPMSASCTPRPSCIGLRPPLVPCGSVGKRSVWLNWSENCARDDL
jgi:hypothetical protein